MHLQSDCGKLILMGHQSCLGVSLVLFFIAPFEALILQGLLKKKNSFVLDYQNMWISGKLALHKVHLMK